MPWQKDLYPQNWPEISGQVKEQAGWKCEQCGVAHLADGTQRTRLTVHHKDHDPANCDRSNLAALCSVCHLRADALWHARNARRTRARKLGQFTFLAWLEEQGL